MQICIWHKRSFSNYCLGVRQFLILVVVPVVIQNISLRRDTRWRQPTDPELCRLAGSFTGIKVKEMLFQELNEIGVYDGIWACSSILHLPKQELLSVIQKMCIALKDNGVIYTSFKYSNFEGERNGRYFTDFMEDTFREFIKVIPELTVEDQWITLDVRPGRGEEKWLNLILRKNQK